MRGWRQRWDWGPEHPVEENRVSRDPLSTHHAPSVHQRSTRRRASHVPRTLMLRKIGRRTPIPRETVLLFPRRHNFQSQLFASSCVIRRGMACAPRPGAECHSPNRLKNLASRRRGPGERASDRDRSVLAVISFDGPTAVGIPSSGLSGASGPRGRFPVGLPKQLRKKLSDRQA